MDAIYRAEALRIILANPLRYAALSAYRFLMLWFDWGVQEAYGSPMTKLTEVTLIQQGLLLLAGVVGAATAWRRGWPLAVTLVVVSILCMAVISRQRFVIPVMPLSVALGALCCTRIRSAPWVGLTSLMLRLPHSRSSGAIGLLAADDRRGLASGRDASRQDAARPLE